MAEAFVTAAAKPLTERPEPEALDCPAADRCAYPTKTSPSATDASEYWDADTAMICDPVSYYHERPASRLARLAGLIAAARGAPIEAMGHTDLLMRSARGQW